MIHPLMTFPILLSYPLLAYFILRMLVVFGTLRMAIMRWKKPHKELSIFQIITGIFVLLGLYTQIALIATVVFMKSDYWLDRKTKMLDPKETIITALICLIALALLFTGPGSFAFDLPL